MGSGSAATRAPALAACRLRRGAHCARHGLYDLARHAGGDGRTGGDGGRRRLSAAQDQAHRRRRPAARRGGPQGRTRSAADRRCERKLGRDRYFERGRGARRHGSRNDRAARAGGRRCAARSDLCAAALYRRRKLPDRRRRGADRAFL